MLQDITLFLVGIIVGAMNAIAGGGMLIGFPVLLAAGVPALVANVTSSVIVLPGQITSVYGYRKFLRKIPRQYLLLAIPCAAGGAIGALILRHTSASNFESIVPWLIIFAVVLFTFQPFLHNHLHRHMHGPAKHRRRLGPVLLVGLAMFPVSIYGGYFGSGFGFIMLAFLGFTKLHEIHRMNALKNLMAICMIVATLACLFNAHLIDWHRALTMGSGAAVGGYAGSRLAQRVPSHAIRIVVIAIGVCTAAYLALRHY